MTITRTHMFTVRTFLLVVVPYVANCAILKESSSNIRGVLSSTEKMRSSSQPYSVASFESWDGRIEGEDPLSEVNDFLDYQEEHRDDLALLEVSTGTGVTKVHGFCEICILIMQMKERGQPHLCAGLNPDYFISCV